jgi:D-alanyl-lipoteichoic acid acyltransferase DltB (MBOAT superfamily)
MVVFLASGLWHGANWTFVVWGALHGLYYVFSEFTRNFREGIVRLVRLDRVPLLYRLIQTGITFTLVSFAWIFFRANSITNAFYIIGHLFDFSKTHEYLRLCHSLGETERVFGLSKADIILSFALICFLQAFYWLNEKRGIVMNLIGRPVWVRYTAYYALVGAIISLGKFNHQVFIYFQF